MDQLTRIEKLLERIAVSLEKQNEVVNITDKHTGCEFMPVYQNEPIIMTAMQAKEMQGKMFKETMMVDDKTADTCRATFDGMPNFGKSPDTQSTHINIKCRNANEFREQYMQQPKVDDSE